MAETYVKDGKVYEKSVGVASLLCIPDTCIGKVTTHYNGTSEIIGKYGDVVGKIDRPSFFSNNDTNISLNGQEGTLRNAAWYEPHDSGTKIFEPLPASADRVAGADSNAQVSQDENYSSGHVTGEYTDSSSANSAGWILVAVMVIVLALICAIKIAAPVRSTTHVYLSHQNVPTRFGTRASVPASQPKVSVTCPNCGMRATFNSPVSPLRFVCPNCRVLNIKKR